MERGRKRLLSECRNNEKNSDWSLIALTKRNLYTHPHTLTHISVVWLLLTMLVVLNHPYTQFSTITTFFNINSNYFFFPPNSYTILSPPLVTFSFSLYFQIESSTHSTLFASLSSLSSLHSIYFILIHFVHGTFNDRPWFWLLVLVLVLACIYCTSTYVYT
jgi:hypothetical protein